MLARARFWRSPDGQPAWARPALLAIAACAAVLYAWNIRASGYAMYYSIAVKSMSVSWKAFFYGALDPGATVTIDKLAGSFVPQALSARLFGYHQWSLTLPQVVEGVIAVLAMYGAVRRWFGVPAALVAAGVFAGTPILASMFGHPMEDGFLTMCLVLAAASFSRAIAEARLRSLIFAGVWVGVGFQAKMLQAWMVLPAMVLTYLFLAPIPWRRRFGHLAVAGAVMLAVSLSWIALYTLTPAAHRPYVDGSTSNSAFAMVFGYNGVDRFGIHLPGAAASMFSSGGAQGGGGGLLKLLGTRYGTQVGWLYPLALLSLGAGLVAYRRTRAMLAGFVFWGLWLLTFAVVFSVIVVPHTAYLASLAPPIAALSGAGIVMFARRWLLPVAVLAEAAWTVWLSRGNPGVFGWLGWAVLGVAVLAVVVLALARARRIVLVAGLSLAGLAIFAAPAAWSASVLDRDYGGSAFDASAGPAVSRGSGPGNLPGGGRPFGNAAGGFPPGFPAGGFPPGFPTGGNGPGGPGPAGNGPPVNGPVNRGPGGGSGGFMNFMSGGDGTLTAEQQAIHRYLVANRGTARYLAAGASWRSIGSYIVATGERYLPLGGFSGSIPAPTLAQVQDLVKRGELHYFLTSGERGPGGPSSITAWVQQACQEVPAEQVGGARGLYAC